MKTFTQIYLDRISEALIDKAMREGKWMTQEEVERMHLSPYRDGVFMVRRTEKPHGKHGWRVFWRGSVGGLYQRVEHSAGKAVTAFERVRRGVDHLYDLARL